MRSRSVCCASRASTSPNSVTMRVCSSGLFFTLHLNCCSLSCAFRLSVFSEHKPHGGRESLHYDENALSCCSAEKPGVSARDFLLKPVVADDTNEIWGPCLCVSVYMCKCVCVCVCVRRKMRKHTLCHFWWIRFLSLSLRHGSVVTVMTSSFLLLFWRAVGGDSCRGGLPGWL